MTNVEAHKPHIGVVTFGIGYGRRAFSESLRETSQEPEFDSRVHLEVVDAFDYVAPWARILLQTSYYGVSPVPGLYKLLRSALDAGNGDHLPVDREALTQKLSAYDVVVSVSGNATKMLGGGTIYPQLISVSGDRFIQHSEVGPHVSALCIPALDIAMSHIQKLPQLIEIGGAIQPPTFLHDAPDEIDRRLTFDGQPHVLSLVNGSGGFQAFRDVFQLARLIKDKHIRYSVFTGHHGLTAFFTHIAAKIARIETVDQGSDVTMPKEGVIYVYHSPTEIGSVKLRNRLVATGDIVHPATAQESSNIPRPVVVWSRANRNQMEDANFKYGSSKGWIVEAGGSISKTLRTLLSPGSKILTQAQRMHQTARAYNNPLAATHVLRQAISILT